MPRHGAASRHFAFAVSAIDLLLGICLAAQWQRSDEGLVKWSSNSFSIINLQFGLSLGVDAISLWLVLLTVLLTPLAILASYQSIKDRPKEYYAWMLALLAAMNGVFIARDLLLFYIFFELTLIPMFFIIGIWGGPERRYAAGKFFLFTFAGSVFTLASVVYLSIGAHSCDLLRVVQYAQQGLDSTQRFCVILGL